MIVPLGLVEAFSKGRSEPEAAQIALNSFFVLIDFDVQAFHQRSFEIEILNSFFVLIDFDVQAFHQRSFEIEILSLSAILEDAVGKLADLDKHATKGNSCSFQVLYAHPTLLVL